MEGQPLQLYCSRKGQILQFAPQGAISVFFLHNLGAKLSGYETFLIIWTDAFSKPVSFGFVSGYLSHHSLSAGTMKIEQIVFEVVPKATR